MKPFLRCGLAQINTTVGHFKSNEKKILSAVIKARSFQVQLLVFPELTLTGYPPEDLLFNPAFIDENLDLLKRIARSIGDMTVILGFVDRDKKTGGLYNAAAVLSRGRIRGIYRKQCLPNYGVFDEKRYFLQGTKPFIADVNGAKIGISICEDLWDQASFVYGTPYRKKLSLLVNLSASPFHQLKQGERKKIFAAAAKKMQAPILYLNLVGGQDEVVFDGGSLILDETGKTIAEASRFGEDFLVRDVPLKRFQKNPKLRTALSPVFKNPPPLREFSKEEEVYRVLVLGTRDYVSKNSFKEVVIGISGGIDSALVAAIAVDALGASRVLGVTMPSPYTSKETRRDAFRLAKNLGFKLQELRIDPIFLAYKKILANLFKGLPQGLAEENLQARIRGALLMAVSNKFGHLTLTTGNKSEVATGYCTLYGDMAGGLAILKDVPKTLVFSLSKWRNAQEGREYIPFSIISRPPTAELRYNQKDEDSLLPYAKLDPLIESYVEKRIPLNKLAGRHRMADSAVLETIRLIDLSEYKRRQGPPGIKITPKAFGKDRRMPITSGYKPWEKEK